MQTTKNTALIEVEVLKRLGIEDNTDTGISGVRMCNPGEIIKIQKDIAKKFQDSGAIKVIL